MHALLLDKSTKELTVDQEIFAVKIICVLNFRSFNFHRPSNCQKNFFIGENFPIYGSRWRALVHFCSVIEGSTQNTLHLKQLATAKTTIAPYIAVLWLQSPGGTVQIFSNSSVVPCFCTGVFMCKQC